MAKLRVIHNMVDTRCGITRRTGEVFEVNDEERIKELLDAKVVEEVKDAAVKKVEPKAEKAVEADIKEVAAAAKETVKDTGAKVVDKAKEVTKKVEKTVKEKVAEVKAAAADPEVYVQYQGNESNLAVITERIKKQYVEEGHKESDIKSLKIYLKPEDASAYYVINDNNSGKVFLF